MRLNNFGTIGELKKTDINDVNDNDLSLAEEAKNEFGTEKQEKKKEQWEISFELDHPELVIKEENIEESKQQTAKKEAEPEKPAEKEAEPVDDNKESKESKEVVKENAQGKQEEKEEAEIQKYALKEGLTLNDAREELQKVKSITEKYKNDPMELARALRHTQSGYDKVRVERDSLKQEYEKLQQRPVAPVSPEVEVRAHIEQNRDNIINSYRQKFPAKTREMEDDAILEEVFDKTLTGYTNWQQQQRQVIKQQATSRREELLNSLSEEDRRFLPDVKVMLNNTSDEQILNKDFDIEYLVSWAWGKERKMLIKEAEERAYKRGLEQPRIVAEIPQASTSPSISNNSKKENKNILTSEYDRKRALEMYEGTSMADDEKYEEYAKILSRQKKNKEK